MLTAKIIWIILVRTSLFFLDQTSKSTSSQINVFESITAFSHLFLYLFPPQTYSTLRSAYFSHIYISPPPSLIINQTLLWRTSIANVEIINNEMVTLMNFLLLFSGRKVKHNLHCTCGWMMKFRTDIQKAQTIFWFSFPMKNDRKFP